MEQRTQQPDRQRHFGLVDDRCQVRDLARAAGATLLEGPFLNFLDPWGNRIEVVEYRDLQFMKTDSILQAMNLYLDKTDAAKAELREKGVTILCRLRAFGIASRPGVPGVPSVLPTARGMPSSYHALSPLETVRQSLKHRSRTQEAEVGPLQEREDSLVASGQAQRPEQWDRAPHGGKRSRSGQ
jgi:hypothetical protein